MFRANKLCGDVVRVGQLTHLKVRKSWLRLVKTVVCPVVSLINTFFDKSGSLGKMPCELLGIVL